MRLNCTNYFSSKRAFPKAMQLVALENNTLSISYVNQDYCHLTDDRTRCVCETSMPPAATKLECLFFLELRLFSMSQDHCI